MMSKTHIAVGAAAALAIAQTGSVESCVLAIVGGSLGGIIADCDITPSKAHRDALMGRLIVAGIALAAFAIDYWYGAGVCNYLLESLGAKLVGGIAVFVALTFVGAHTDHRSFTHSLVAMMGFCVAVWLAFEPMLPFFVTGYASHLVMDLTNYQPIKLLWPMKRGFGLGLCHAKRLANSVMLIVGTVATTLLLAYRLAPLFGIAITIG